MSKLVDTNIIIDYLRHHPPAIALIDGMSAKPRVSVVSVMELHHGARSKREEDRIERLLEGAQELPVTAAIARAAGQYLKHYQSAHGVDEIDALIAATAEHHELELATLNVKHFPMFKRLKAAY